MKKVVLYSILWCCVFSISAQNQKEAYTPIKVLIVDGFSNHDWQQTTKMTKHILEKTNLFTVSVSTAPSSAAAEWPKWDPRFSDYDVIIQNTNDIDTPAWKWPRTIEKKLEDYVKNGGGLYILHSANNAFSHWAEYDRMIGLGWRKIEQGIALAIDGDDALVEIPAGEGRDTFHGDRYDAVITIRNEHPIHKNFPKVWKTPNMELYKYARGPAENLTVLFTSYDSETDRSWPVEWVVSFGKGRVYNSSMGHLWKGETYPDSYRCVGYRTILTRAVEWLARKKVTYAVPEDFPTADHIRLVKEKAAPK